VGDNERTDIGGAKALGMVAVQYTGLAKLGGWLPEQLSPSGLADHVVDDLAAVPGVLGF
jgi:FMN phosphatase YigB (HAD superfamily)